ncbi:MAG: hypothetical protein IT426_04655 [Pirellulales bacterium]|nr:hypothetical protein [Pirellulales bacterium]
MRWGRRWPERTPRPKVRRLTEAEQAGIVRILEEGIATSPVLSAFGIKIRLARGRFYLERQRQGDGLEPDNEVWGRITPLAGTETELLLEAERRSGNWFEVVRGEAARLVKIIAGDTKGTFHGLGFLDASLRKLEKGQERLPMALDDNGNFVYTDTGEGCSVQEALFHYFGLPVEVIAEPSGWYSYHRRPRIVEASDDRTRVLVRFTAESMSGASLGGACLYIQREEQWAAYAIKPSDSQTIARAEAWLAKRKWRAW